MDGSGGGRGRGRGSRSGREGVHWSGGAEVYYCSGPATTSSTVCVRLWLLLWEGAAKQGGLCPCRREIERSL